MQKLNQDMLNAISMMAEVAAQYRKELLAQGFTAIEAMELTKAFIDAQVRPQQSNSDQKKPIGLFGFQ